MKLGWMANLWPGLAYLARYGAFGTWCVTMFYALCAMGMLTVGLVWTEIIPDATRNILWVIFAMIWFLGIFATTRSVRARQESDVRRRKESIVEDTLPLAQIAFLRREFYESETLLRKRLEKFPEDVPARLLLVSVLERQERLPEAFQQISVLESLPNLGPWWLETSRQKQKMQG